MSTGDSPTQTQIRQLPADTFLQGVTWYSETDSTNSQSLQLLSENSSVPTPHLVFAETQRAGRGRGSNTWWSGLGSLTFSVIVDFTQLGLDATDRPLLPLLTGLAVLRAVKALLPDRSLVRSIGLKWPNDVFIENRKLAGVLIEVSGVQSQHAVVGVGINVNNSFVDAPLSLQETGIALIDELDQSCDSINVLRQFLIQFELVIEQQSKNHNALDDWSKHCILKGKHVVLGVGSNDIRGICAGIDSTGALLLNSDAGQQRFVGGIVKSWQ